MTPLPAAWAEAVVGWRFLRDTPGFLRRPPVEAGARREIGARLARRAADLEALVGRAVFERPAGLYGELMRAAGCERGDFRALLAREGVEGALEALRRAGVYLSVDEFKGRRDVVRGSLTLAAGPPAVRNPAARFHVPARSSGSRGGTGTPILIDLDYVRDNAVSTSAALAGWGAGGTERATWEVPGGGALYRLLEFAACDGRVAHWFSRLPLDGPEIAPRYRRSAAALRLAGRLAGRRFGRPEVATLEDPGPILRWMRAVLTGGGRPLLVAMTSAALRLAEAACAAGADLSGGWIVAGGEPLTPARRDALRSAGLGVVPRYGAIEVGALGYGCAAPRHADDLHFVSDLHALVQAAPPSPPERDAQALPAGALYFTSLRPSAPFALINVSLGDSAVRAERACGCPLEGLGWTTHLHTVRSFEKLTAGGANFLDVDVVRVLEEVLPVRFGGGIGDYQLVEDETETGRPRLRLRVHPRLGALPEEVVAHAFLAALGTGSGAERLMAMVWSEGQMLEIEREPPLATVSGKTLHVHRGS